MSGLQLHVPFPKLVHCVDTPGHDVELVHLFRLLHQHLVLGPTKIMGLYYGNT